MPIVKQDIQQRGFIRGNNPSVRVDHLRVLFLPKQIADEYCTGPTQLYAVSILSVGLIGALMTADTLLLLYAGVPIGLGAAYAAGHSFLSVTINSFGAPLLSGDHDNTANGRTQLNHRHQLKGRPLSVLI